MTTSSVTTPGAGEAGHVRPEAVRCQDLAALRLESSVGVFGWVTASRDLGAITFLTLADYTGSVQVVVGPEICRRVPKPGDFVRVRGAVVARPRKNARHGTQLGDRELRLDSVDTIRTGRGAFHPPDVSRRVMPWREPTTGALSVHGFRESTGFYTEEADGHVASFGPRFRFLNAGPRGAGQGDLIELCTSAYWTPRFDAVMEDVLGTALPSVRRQAVELPQAASRTSLSLVVVQETGRVVAIIGTTDRPESIELSGADAVRPAIDLDRLCDEVFGRESNQMPGLRWAVLDADVLAFPHSSQPRALTPVEQAVSILRSVWRERTANTFSSSDIDRDARVLQQWDVEASAALALSIGPTEGGTALEQTLERFEMTGVVRERLLGLWGDALRARIESSSDGERFQWFWSILGTAEVRRMLASEEDLAALAVLVREGVLTEPPQLLHLDGATVQSLTSILATEPDEDRALRSLLRAALATTGASFSALVASIATLDATGRDALRGPGAREALSKLASSWLCAPGVVHACLRAGSALEAAHLAILLQPAVAEAVVTFEQEGLEAIGRAVRAIYERGGFPAVTLEERTDRAAGFEAAFATYRPLTLTFHQANALVEASAGLSQHLAQNHLRPGGPHWDEATKRYRVDSATSTDTVTGYVSKSDTSALAKSSVGVCTAGDMALYARPDHFHVNLFDERHGAVVGNLQCHTLQQRGRQILLLRSVNATQTYLDRAGPRFLAEAALVMAIELAQASGYDEAHLGEGLSYWHLRSSKPALLAVLNRLTEGQLDHVFDDELYLYEFSGRRIGIQRTKVLWSRDETTFPPIEWKMNDVR